MCRRVFLICGVIAAVAALKINDDRVEDLKKRLDDIKNQLHDDDAESRSEQLKEIVSKISWKDSRRGIDIEGGFLCGMCYLVMNELLNMRRVQNKSEENIKRLALEMCVDFEIQSEEVCHGVIELNAPSVFFIIDNRPNLTANTVCRMLLNDGDCVNTFDDNNLEFSVEIDSGTSSRTTRARGKARQKVEDLTVVHFSDIHVDLKYVVGAFTDCDEFACCRETDETNETESIGAAGYWGDYRNCDTPWRAIIDVFDQIRRQHPKIDAIYFTGDIVDHFVWDVTIATMKNQIAMVYNQMKLVFGDIPVFSILGNHEAQNIFPPVGLKESSLSVQWLYDHIVELWRDQLPSNALDSVKAGGYYTTIVRRGLRLIALNNNVCSTFNWWILYEVKSIQQQFQWLHDTLLAAEKAREKVHILSHIPNGDDDYHQPCSREYRRIIERFHRIIVAQFNGHSEFFGFNLFYKQNTEISVAFNGGSLATFSGVNRNYNVYNLDPHSFEVKDVESWIYNLTAANQNGMQNPIWFRQFSLRESFNLKDLSLSTLGSFVSNLSRNTTAIQQFWRMSVKESDLKLQEGCSKTCLQQTLCDILITDNNETARCQQIKKEVEAL